MEKNLAQRVKRLRARNPGVAVEVWTQDEARLGLKPTSRRMWAPKGRRPVCCGRSRFEWFYVYGFARPATGQTFTVFRPRVKHELMSEALAEFAAHADPEGKKLLVIVLDNAGWHVAKDLQVPPNVVLHFLPPSTPELSPIEPLWPLVKECVANDTFHRLSDMKRRVRRRCKRLQEDPATVKGAVGFRWAVALER